MPTDLDLDLRDAPAGHAGGLALSALQGISAGTRLRLRTREDPELLLRSANLHLQFRLAWTTCRIDACTWEAVVRLLDELSAPDPVDALLRDHRWFDRTLAEVMRALESGAGGEARAGLDALAVRLQRHVAVEDDILAPACAAGSPGVPDSPLETMLSEHREILAHVQSLRDGLAAASGDLFEPCVLCGMLSGLVAKHEHREEANLFPLWRAALARLAPQERAKLYGRVAAALR